MNPMPAIATIRMNVALVLILLASATGQAAASSVELPLVQTTTISHETSGSRALLDFGRLPEAIRGELVLTAHLSLPISELTPEDRSAAFSLYAVTTPWADRSPTWTSPWRTPGGDIVTEPAATDVVWKRSARSALSFDVTDVLRDIADGLAEDCGFLLSVPAHRGEGFRSEDLASLGTCEGAKLRITYSPVKHLGFNGSRSVVEKAQRLRAKAALKESRATGD